MDVPYYGKYSIERLEGLRHYSKTASLSRAILVCVATPVPALATMLLLESIPLQPPWGGWRANWGFWLRIALSVFVISLMGVFDMVAMVPTLDLSPIRRVAIAAGTASGYTGFFLLAASVVGFPVPMMWQLGAIPGSIFFPLMLLVTMGRRAVTTPSTMRTYVGRHLRYFTSHLTVFGLYPLYMALYDSFPSRYQVAALLVLPVWRAISKYGMVWVSKHAEDFLPGLIAFVIDVFDSLFLFVCLQNATSVASIALVLSVDCTHSVWTIRDIGVNSGRVMSFVRDAQRDQERNQPAPPVDLLDMLAAIAGNPESFQIDKLPAVRLWAYLPHRVTPAASQRMKRLQALAVYRGGRASLSPFTAVSMAVGPSRGSFRTRSVMPVSSSSSYESWTQQRKSRTSSGICPVQLVDGVALPSVRRAAAKQLLVQSLKLLFHCEYVLLVEYVECIIPIVYVVYVSVVARLPNAVYYPRRQYQQADASVYVLVYSLLEIASLVVLGAILRRRFRFSPIHQLAYVLETQVVQIQAKLFLAVVCLLQFKLMHLGTHVVASEGNRHAID